MFIAILDAANLFTANSFVTLKILSENPIVVETWPGKTHKVCSCIKGTIINSIEDKSDCVPILPFIYSLRFRYNSILSFSSFKL